MQIAIQGALGSFHHEAARQLMPHAIVVPKQAFSDVFKSVQDEGIEYGLCAIENTLYGPIEEVYQLLRQSTVRVTQDIRLQIAQHLIGPVTVSIEELQRSQDVRILSQAPALAQAERWIAAHLPHATITAAPDTAGSVKKVMGLAQPHTLAIAGRIAAVTYDGTIVAEDIQDSLANYTRFLLFQDAPMINPEATHGLILLELAQGPDVPAKALQVFTDTGSSVTNVRSVLALDGSGGHMMYIDYSLPEEGSAQILAALQIQGYLARLLGEYTAGPIIKTV